MAVLERSSDRGREAAAYQGLAKRKRKCQQSGLHQDGIFDFLTIMHSNTQTRVQNSDVSKGGQGLEHSLCDNIFEEKHARVREQARVR